MLRRYHMVKNRSTYDIRAIDMNVRKALFGE
ncbi:hypothetical protein GGR19_002151 [Croceicoccus naphthovorans]|nr:hypothetical protein [Croceicoccus naphthovorans]